MYIKPINTLQIKVSAHNAVHKYSAPFGIFHIP